MRKTAIVLFVLLFCASFFGCSGTQPITTTDGEIWSFAGKDSLRSGRADGEILPPFGALWTKRLDGLGISSSSILKIKIDESENARREVVFVSGGEKTTAAMVVETGETLWQINLPSKPLAPVAFEDSVVFVTMDGVIQCMDGGTGNQNWALRYTTEGEKISYEVAQPVISGGTVFFGFGNGLVLGLNIADGKEVWRKNLGDRINSSPVVVSGKLIVADYSNKIAAFRSYNGEEVWNTELSEPVIAQLASDGKTVFVSGVFGTVYGINVEDGTVTWQTNVEDSVIHGSCLVGDSLFIPMASGKIVNMNKLTGEINSTIQSDVPSTGIVSAGNNLLFATETGKLMVVDIKSNQVTEAYKFETWEENVSGQSFGDISISSGKVFVSDGQSKFFCLVPKDIAINAHSVK
ncbi:MAG: PQQ-binding-like beta-propeller repeat protein [Caldisericia bacterium]